MFDKRCLIKIMYICLFILLICYGGSLATYICLFYENYGDYAINNKRKKYKLEFFGKTFIITNITTLTLIFIKTTLFACYSNCFLSKCILLFYIISLSLMIIIELPSFFILLEYILNNLNELVAIIMIIFILNIIEVIFGFISILISISLRNFLILEIVQSPLNFIDLDITENIYNNIFQKSGKNKNDKKNDNNDDNNDNNDNNKNNDIINNSNISND